MVILLETINITRTVNVKVKVTDTYKRKVMVEIQETIRRLDLELQHLEFHGKRMLVELEKNNPNGIPKAKEHIQLQKNKRLETKEKFTQSLKEIAGLAIGSEVLHSNVESPVEVRVGDDWNKVMGMEIVICDEKVIEIRPEKV